MSAPNASSQVQTPRWMDSIAAFVVIWVTITEVFTTVAPYFGMAPTVADPTLAAQQQAIMQNVFIAIVAFLTGSSVATRKKDETIAMQAQTAAAAQSALPPVPGAPDKTVPIAAGETVAVKSNDSPP